MHIIKTWMTTESVTLTCQCGATPVHAANDGNISAEIFITAVSPTNEIICINIGIAIILARLSWLTMNKRNNKCHLSCLQLWVLGHRLVTQTIILIFFFYQCTVREEDGKLIAENQKFTSVREIQGDDMVEVSDFFICLISCDKFKEIGVRKQHALTVSPFLCLFRQSLLAL